MRLSSFVSRALNEETLERREHRLRVLFGQVVACLEWAPGDIRRGFTPYRQVVPAIVSADPAPPPPQRQRWCGDLAAGRVVRVVVLEIDRRGGAIVLAGSVDRFRREASNVFVERPFIEKGRRSGSA